MSRKQFNPSDGNTESEAGESENNRSLIDVLTLPNSEQELIAWMRRQKNVSLAEIVAHMNQDEEAISTMLNSLSNQGFVEILNVDGELRYRTVAPKKRTRPTPQLWQDLDF
jgi:predicted transcriptional regulator